MSFYYEFNRECRSGGNKLTNVRSLIILLPGEGLTSFSIYNCTNFFGEKKKIKLKLSGVSFYREHAQTYSYSFLSSNLKLSNCERETTFFPLTVTFQFV